MSRRRQFVKVYGEDLRTSSRFRRLGHAAQGVYLKLLTMIADQDGLVYAYSDGGFLKPYTAHELSAEMFVPRSTLSRAIERLTREDCRLVVAVDPGPFVIDGGTPLRYHADTGGLGVLWIPRFSEKSGRADIERRGKTRTPPARRRLRSLVAEALATPKTAQNHDAEQAIESHLGDRNPTGFRPYGHKPDETRTDSGRTDVDAATTYDRSLPDKKQNQKQIDARRHNDRKSSKPNVTTDGLSDASIRKRIDDLAAAIRAGSTGDELAEWTELIRERSRRRAASTSEVVS